MGHTVIFAPAFCPVPARADSQIKVKPHAGAVHLGAALGFFKLDVGDPLEPAVELDARRQLIDGIIEGLRVTIPQGLRPALPILTIALGQSLKQGKPLEIVAAVDLEFLIGKTRLRFRMLKEDGVKIPQRGIVACAVRNIINAHRRSQLGPLCLDGLQNGLRLWCTLYARNSIRRNMLGIEKAPVTG